MDFAALASRMAAGLEGVRACLIVSGDGLSLGAYPDHAEPMARSVWERLSAVGDPQRGFFSVGDELWVVARRGWYAALLIASPTVKPGLVLDRLESYLRTAEESRIREAAELTGPPGTAEAPRRLRTPLHRERPEPREPTVPAAPERSETPPKPATQEPASREGPSSPLRSQEGLPPRALEPTPSAAPPPPAAQLPPPVETKPAPPPPPPVVAEAPVSPPVSPSVSPPAPEPPPVARPEPEVEAPRPQPAAAAPDPPAEAEPEVEAPEPRPAVEEVAPVPVPAEVVVDMTGAERRPAEPEAVGAPEEKEPAQDVKGDPSKTEVDKVALTREFSQLFGEVDGSEQG